MSLEPICSNIYNSKNLQRIVHCFIFFFSENREKTLSTYSDIIKFRLKCVFRFIFIYMDILWIYLPTVLKVILLCFICKLL
ncbi:hypothetical protein PO909_000031 [Leuciscus waleckii]